MSTVFAQIIKGEIPTEKVYEDEKFLVIRDLYPVAPVHLLIIPKKEIQDLQSITVEDTTLMGELMLIAQKLAVDFDVVDGYRLLTNNGVKAGQSVFHLHFHLIGGRELGPIA